MKKTDPKLTPDFLQRAARAAIQTGEPGVEQWQRLLASAYLFAAHSDYPDPVENAWRETIQDYPLLRYVAEARDWTKPKSDYWVWLSRRIHHATSVHLRRFDA